jgi:hypothetical protein
MSWTVALVTVRSDAHMVRGLLFAWRNGDAAATGITSQSPRPPARPPVFANTRFNRGIDRFRRRGRAAVRPEWRLITATHNLLKLHRHAAATA